MSTNTLEQIRCCVVSGWYNVSLDIKSTYYPYDTDPRIAFTALFEAPGPALILILHVATRLRSHCQI